MTWSYTFVVKTQDVGHLTALGTLPSLHLPV